MTQHDIISVTTPTPCSLPENRDIFDTVIDITVQNPTNPGSKRRLPWIKAARDICGGCPERNQCLDVHGRDYSLGVVAGATDAQRQEFFEGKTA